MFSVWDNSFLASFKASVVSPWVKPTSAEALIPDSISSPSSSFKPVGGENSSPALAEMESDTVFFVDCVEPYEREVVSWTLVCGTPVLEEINLSHAPVAMPGFGVLRIIKE